MSTNTIQLHRVLRAVPERVYRAFLDADAMCRWLPPNGFTGKVHHLEAKVGGTYKMSFTNFTTGHSHSFGGKYLELTPNERICHIDEFDDPNMPGTIPPRLAISGGKSRSIYLRNSLRPEFQGSKVLPTQSTTLRVDRHAGRLPAETKRECSWNSNKLKGWTECYPLTSHIKDSFIATSSVHYHGVAHDRENRCR
jgi:uncharacterized protein YndB with AHSA1/START domain